MSFSKEWTNEERLKLVALLAGQIQEDIPAGVYGAPCEFNDKGVPTKFRPNLQSIIEIIAAPAEVLEQDREQIEAFVREQVLSFGETEADFYDTTIEQQREQRLEFLRQLDLRTGIKPKSSA